jgi:hypothetical protein
VGGRAVAAALRFFLLGCTALFLVGVAGRYSSWPLLTTTLGPTLYVFIAHPRSETARFHKAVLGHGVGVASGLAALALFGQWHHASPHTASHPSLTQVAAVAVALGLTLAILHISGAHYAPAAATTILVSSGLAAPGRPLYGMLIGLAAVLVVGPFLGLLPGARAAAAEGDTDRRHT